MRGLVIPIWLAPVLYVQGALSVGLALQGRWVLVVVGCSVAGALLGLAAKRP